MALCTLEEWLRRMGIQRQKCNIGHKNFKKAERESPENMCYTSMPVWSGDSGIDRTTTETASV